MIYVAVLLAAEVARAAPPCSPAPEKSEIKAAKTLAYQKGANGQLLDIHYPRGRKPPYRTIMWIHGGCFRYGRKDDDFDLRQIEKLTDQGYAVVSVNYRLADPDHADPDQRHLYPAAWNDVMDAVCWVRQQGKGHGLDTRRLAAFGYSAGATLAAYLGTRPIRCSDRSEAAQPDLARRVDAVVDLFGRTDFAHARADEARQEKNRDCAEVFLGQNRSASNAKLFKEASVLSGVNDAAAEFLLLHGTDDRAVSVEHSCLLYRKLTEPGAELGAKPVCAGGDQECQSGGRARFCKIAGADHMFEGCGEMEKAWSQITPFLTKVYDQPGAPAVVLKGAGAAAR